VWRVASGFAEACCNSRSIRAMSAAISVRRVRVIFPMLSFLSGCRSRVASRAQVFGSGSWRSTIKFQAIEIFRFCQYDRGRPGVRKTHGSEAENKTTNSVRFENSGMPSPPQLNEVSISGHRCQVLEPAVRNPHGWSVVFLHDIDAAGLTGRSALIDQFASRGLPCIAPITGRSWWTERIWPEFDPTLSAEQFVMDHVLGWVAENWQSKPPQLAIMGVGMGGQGALRLSFKYPNKLPIVAAVTPAIDYQLAYYDDDEEALRELYAEPEAARQDTAILHVHPLNWPRNQWFSCDPEDPQWFSSAERLKMKLSALGIPHDADLETSAAGQSLTYADRMAVPAVGYLVERLERERLRVS
jgi:hypothetical protein